MRIGELRHFLEGGATELATRQIKSSRVDRTTRKRIRIRKTTLATAYFCYECIGEDEVVKLDLEPKLISVSVTATQAALTCLEMYVRSLSPLNQENRFIPALFWGTLVHRAIASYFKQGSDSWATEWRRSQALVASTVQGQVIPDWVKTKLLEIATFVHKCKKHGFNTGNIKTREAWELIEEVRFVGNEVAFRFRLSELRSFFGLPTGGLHDAYVVGSIDLLVLYEAYPGYQGQVAIVGDYKTIWPKTEAEQQRIQHHYGHSLQLLFYALIAHHITAVPIENVVIRPIFLDPEGPKQTQDFRILAQDQARIAVKVLDRIQNFVNKLGDAELQRGRRKGYQVLDLYPPSPSGDVCPRCPSYGVCSATRGLSTGAEQVPHFSSEEQSEQPSLFPTSA